MNKIWKVIIPTTFALSCSLSFAATCNSTIDNNTLSDLTIPAGATCTVNNASIEGDVNIQKDASLILNSSSVQGSIQANQAKAVRLINSSVSGDVHAAQTTTMIHLEKSVISGDLQCSASTRLKTNLSSIEGQKTGKCR
ncbi:hypothetical protein ACNQO6_00805 [Acinetobacter calcoaceticus]|uniref:hypothetical protein n=1 Tax=Acinetobacter calcoaceticus TaxID=471 RepID=UPI002B30E30B|nr:hypothetical protein SB581_06855 [Acinetobacter baumannii]